MSKELSDTAVFRKDYQPYPWALEEATFKFFIDDECTRVQSTLNLVPRGGQGEDQKISLDGRDLELVSVAIDGRRLDDGAYDLRPDGLDLPYPGGPCRVDIEVRIRPDENTALQGLYRSGDFLLTQCEAEGFRQITYFPDRPDVMTRFDVTVEADRHRYPVLLSNGNAVESGEGDDGRHWVRWVDPFAKPSYLFALVAGDLACIEDRFETRNGRDVAIRFYVEPDNAGKCAHAVQSLIKAMKWDEDRFGLEYDLDVYHVVATNDFNMGAMENKSLNIFNSIYVLASPETATDANYQGIESVIGHEYFHNWTGNRVTCRDWFQLTLKEGLTVFRDQEFTSDMQSRAVKRIQDVRFLRSQQFPEDAGPMAHPIRPDKYKEINNFYTMTVYQKGAEIIRMYHALLGEEGFQRGMRLYFERHDGQAVTCDDFLVAMADANGCDLSGLGHWYGQSGTPVVTARGEYDEASRCYTLSLSQHVPPTPDQSDKTAVMIPFKMGLLGQDGRALTLDLERGGQIVDDSALLLLESVSETYVFRNIDEAPVPSLLRDFSAPIELDYPYRDEELAVLMGHDSNDFVRWEAAQRLAQRTILDNVARRAKGVEMRANEVLETAFLALLRDDSADPALLAQAMMLPDEAYLAEAMREVDVEGIHEARNFLRSGLANRFKALLLERYESLTPTGPYDNASSEIARRSLRNVILAYLMETPAGMALADAQLAASDNMTDTLAALQGLVWKGTPSAEASLAAFEQRWINDPLVLDKWYSIQAATPGRETVNRVAGLMGHPTFNLRNPNRVRAVLGVLSHSNPTAFHAGNGAGYRLLADQILALDELNPQVAARLAGAFNRWTRYDADRRRRMRAQLERLAGSGRLSPNTAEIVGNSLSLSDPDEA
ncbi:MAG: aminopeptidase N [Gammaproteobacteria bacterium]|nr:aminopeptidase N [Gammaproteobacteria bacterium]